MPTPLPQSQPKERFPLVDLFFLLVLFWQFVILTPSLLFSPLKHTHTLTHKLYSHGFLVLAPDPMLSAFPFLELILVTWKAGSRVTAHIKKKKKKIQRKRSPRFCTLIEPAFLPAFLPPSFQGCPMMCCRYPGREATAVAAAAAAAKLEACSSPFSLLYWVFQAAVLHSKETHWKAHCIPSTSQACCLLFFSLVSPHNPPAPLPSASAKGRKGEGERILKLKLFLFFFSPDVQC